jgi:hypothetical protein
MDKRQMRKNNRRNKIIIIENEDKNSKRYLRKQLR